MARLELDNHAIAAMTHAQNLEPSHAPGWFNLGSVQQRTGMHQEAISSYKRSIEADESYVKAGEKWASLARDEGLLEAFMDAARALLRMNEGHDIKHEFIQMLLQLAQGESNVMDHVSGLPPTLPAGPEMAKEALGLMGDEASAQRATAPLIESTTQRCRSDVESHDSTRAEYGLSLDGSCPLARAGGGLRDG